MMVERLCNSLVFVRGADDEAIFIPKQGGLMAGARRRGSSCASSCGLSATGVRRRRRTRGRCGYAFRKVYREAAPPQDGKIATRRCWDLFPRNLLIGSALGLLAIGGAGFRHWRAPFALLPRLREAALQGHMFNVRPQYTS